MQNLVGIDLKQRKSEIKSIRYRAKLVVFNVKTVARIAQLQNLIPGIFGVFFFLTRKEIGNIIFKRLYINLVGSMMQLVTNLPYR